MAKPRVYVTLRKIAKVMQWKSPATVLRRHKYDEFPLYPMPTKRGWVWVTSDALIDEWERRKAELSRGTRLRRPYFWRHRKEIRTGTKEHIVITWKSTDLREGELLCQWCGELKEKCACKSANIQTNRHKPWCGLASAKCTCSHKPQPNPLLNMASRMANDHFARRVRASGQRV